MKLFFLLLVAYVCGGICLTIYFQPKIVSLQDQNHAFQGRLDKIDSSLTSNAALRKNAIEDRKIMQLKLDSILKNQDEVKIWHYQGLVRTVQRDVKLDSINAKLTKKIK